MSRQLLDAELGYLLLTVGTHLPAVFGALVAANVDILRWEDVHHLVDDILGEA